MKDVKTTGYVRVQCSKCGEYRTINTTNPKLYTKEVRDKFVCIWCKKTTTRKERVA